MVYGSDRKENAKGTHAPAVFTTFAEMNRISAVVITLNERRNIRRCLRSLLNLADEVIVLDSGSKDDTEQICLEFEFVRFVKTEWKGYAATKNYGHSLAKYPFILSIDADEALSDTLRSSILKEKPKLKGVYYFSRLTYYCGKPVKYSGWYPDYKTRLFPAEKARWVGDFVHETLEVDVNCTRQLLIGDLLHYSFYSVEEHLERIEKYTTLAAEERYQKGKKGGKLKGVLSAAVRFLKIYFFKLGFLDGHVGFLIAKYSAYAAYLKSLKIKKLNENK